MTTLDTRAPTDRPPASPSRRPGRLRRGRARTGVLFVAPAAVLLAVFFVVPLLSTVWMSLHDWPLFGDREFIGLDNWAAALSDDIVTRSIGFTLLYAVVSVGTTFVLGFALAMLIQRGGRAVGFFRTVYFLPTAIGFALAALLWGFLYNERVGVFAAIVRGLGITDETVLFLGTPTGAVLSVLVMVVWKGVGLTMLVMLVGLQSVPEEIYEAAGVDGATARQKLWWITLPLMRRTFALLLVLGVSGALLSFDQFFILTAGGPDRSTITVVYAIYRAFSQYQLGYASTIGLLLLLALLVINAIQIWALRRGDDD